MRSLGRRATPAAHSTPVAPSGVLATRTASPRGSPPIADAASARPPRAIRSRSARAASHRQGAGGACVRGRRTKGATRRPRHRPIGRAAAAGSRTSGAARRAPQRASRRRRRSACPAAAGRLVPGGGRRAAAAAPLALAEAAALELERRDAGLGEGPTPRRVAAHLPQAGGRVEHRHAGCGARRRQVQPAGAALAARVEGDVDDPLSHGARLHQAGNEQGRPEAALIRCMKRTRKPRPGGTLPAFLCSPVPGLDSAGLPNKCGA